MNAVVASDLQEPVQSLVLGAKALDQFVALLHFLLQSMLVLVSGLPGDVQSSLQLLHRLLQLCRSV